MSGPGSGGTNPRKFSEKIALHNQKQAEETRAFEQLMTDLTVSRVQFQKVQQLRLSQSRGQYYGGSLPNVNQMCNTAAENQASFPQTLDPRGTRHHGLVERVQRPRISSPHAHRRGNDKHRHGDGSSPYGPVYLSPPPDHTWRRDGSWMEDKRPGFRLMSQLNRTNSDSALHTSVMNPPGAFGPNQSHDQSQNPNLNRAPQRNTSLNEAEDGSADIFSFPVGEDALMGTRPLPKQLWDAKVQSLASKPKSCEVPGINIFPSPDQNMAAPQFPSCQNPGLGPGMGSGLTPGLTPGLGLNSGGSLPDLTNLQFPSPLSTPLDSEENYNHHLPHAMMQLGLSSSLSNPSLCSSPRRRPTPISPLTLSPEQQRVPPTLTQGVPLESPMREPPPPYPLYPQSHCAPGQASMAHSAPGRQQQQLVSPLNSPQAVGAPHLQGTPLQQTVSPLQSPTSLTPLSPHTQQGPVQNQVQGPQTQRQLQYGSGQSMFGSDPFMEASYGQNKNLPFQLENFNFLDGSGVGGNCSFDPASSSSASSSLFYNPAPQTGLHDNSSSGHIPQHGLRGNASSRPPPMLFPNAALPNIILTDESVNFSLEDELRIEPLTLDGLSMLSDPELVLPDPGVEDSFRSDRL